MLILTRKDQESLIIGDTIRVTVLNIDRGQIKLGIEAPNDIDIVREEIADRHKKPGNSIS